MHSLFVPNIALFPTDLSFFTADRLSYFENLAIAPITSGLRQQIKLTIKRFQKRKWPEFFSGFRTTSSSMHGADTRTTTCVEVGEGGHNLVFTGQCGTGKTHLLRCLFIYKFVYSNLTFKCRIQGRSSIFGEGQKVKRGWVSNIGKESGGSESRRKTGILRLRHEVSHFCF